MSKLNLVRPQGVSILLGGKEYNLVYDFNAFALLENSFGNLQKAFDSLGKNPKFGDILIFLEAGFSSNDNPPSKKVLGSYLTPQNVAGVIELIGEALNIAMPQEEISKSKN